jgi:hypothetical protein
MEALLGAQCACKGDVDFLVQAKMNGKQEVWYYSDSWFTSVKAVRGLKKEFRHKYFGGALKTNHSGPPKVEIKNL